jgi:aminopeptidase
VTPEERLDKYARLAVEVGSNVGEGQTLWLTGYLENAPLIRAIARVAYEKGARYVDVDYVDAHARHARIEHAPEETLDWTPPWVLTRTNYLIEHRGALIQVAGDPEPELFADLDGAKVGKTRMKENMQRYLEAVNKRLVTAAL